MRARPGFLALPTLIGVGESLFHHEPGGGGDDRPARAQEALSIALDGGPHALTAARLIFKQRTASATDAGRSAYQSAWSSLQNQRPELAGQAAIAGGVDDPPSNDPTFPKPGTYTGYSATNAAGTGYTPPAPRVEDQQSALERELDSLIQNVKGDVGDSAQRILGGAGASINNRLNPNAGAVTIPTNANVVLLVGGLFVLMAFMMVMAGRRR